MYTLGPYGALAWVGIKIGEKMLEIKLPRVEFPSGRDELPSDIEDYLSRLVQILHDKNAILILPGSYPAGIQVDKVRLGIETNTAALHSHCALLNFFCQHSSQTDINGLAIHMKTAFCHS